MRRDFSRRLAVALLAGSSGFCAVRSASCVELRGRVVDSKTGEPVAARIYIENAAGRSFFAKSASRTGSAIVYDKRRGDSIERHTTVSAHPFVVDLPAGDFTLTVERGKEYLTATREITVDTEAVDVKIELRRWIDMAARGWYSGETHVHRSTAEMPNLLLAEDLNVAFPLTYWVTRAHEAPRDPGRDGITGETRKGSTDEGRWIDLDGSHFVYPRNTEYEIFSVGGKRHTLGAVFLIRHRTLFRQGVPPLAPVLAQARNEGALIELDKHNWPWSMALVPILDVDLYELSNNHIWRTDFLFKDWGEQAAPWMGCEKGTERGWIDFGFQNYYTLLDCGFRLRPTAGCASGVHPVPLGFGRVYVEVPGKLDGDAWLAGLDAGRSFVTTGPMLLVKVNDRPAGQTISVGPEASREYRVKAECHSPHPFSAVEIIVNGEVARTVKARPRRSDAGALALDVDETIEVAGSSWIAVRVFTKLASGRVRFAHSSPVHIDIRGRPLRPRRIEVEYLAGRVREQIERSSGTLPAAAIAEYREALAAYEKLLPTAR